MYLVMEDKKASLGLDRRIVKSFLISLLTFFPVCSEAQNAELLFFGMAEIYSIFMYVLIPN